ncbi:IPT/TIG domain-containing protein, partial [bacterium]|nr:IPT/TIG domain-containing protein [bacterium]
IKRWAFDTGGEKEVWAEVKDDVSSVAQCHADIFVHPAENQRPDPPTDLVQLLPDRTKISVGGAVDERTVVFKGVVTDPDGDRVKLQIELRRLDEYGGEFDETQEGLKESDFVASSSEAEVSFHGLIPGDYHWRARTIDEYGEVSEWADFGNNPLSDPDFIVVSEGDDNPRIVCIEPESGAPGIEARIKGKNFDNIVGIPQVTFGFLHPAKIIDGWSDSDIVVEVPPGDGTVDVTVSGPGRRSNSVKFIYKEPAIDFIQPLFGKPGTEVTIEGRDFGLPRSLLNSVRFGKSTAQYEKDRWSDTKIVVEAPSDYGTGENDREILIWLIKLAVYGYTGDIPGLILDIVDELLSSGVEIPPSESRIQVDVRVNTPAGETSNAAVFTYRVSTIIETYLCSPGELRVYDSLGRVTGLVNGEVKEEIPYSLCDGSTAIIVSPQDSYRYEVVGTDEGIYRLVVNSVENGETTTFTATDIPTAPGAIHQYTIDWEALSQGE